MMISYDCGFKTSILLEILILFKKMNKARDSGTMNIMAGEITSPDHKKYFILKLLF